MASIVKIGTRGVTCQYRNGRRRKNAPPDPFLRQKTGYNNEEENSDGSVLKNQWPRACRDWLFYHTILQRAQSFHFQAHRIARLQPAVNFHPRTARQRAGTQHLAGY